MPQCQFVATTPAKLTEQILAWCKVLEPEAEPLWLTNEPTSWAGLGRCYVNVQQLGRPVQYGWTIWELPGIYFTAEHHAVAILDGQFFDPTPQLGGERKLLFLPSKLAWAGKPIISRYLPAKDTPLCHRVCELQERNVVLFHAGKFGSPEHRANDNAAAGLTARFYRVQRERRRAKKKRKQ